MLSCIRDGQVPENCQQAFCRKKLVTGMSSFLNLNVWLMRNLFVSVKNRMYLLSCISCSSMSTVLSQWGIFCLSDFSEAPAQIADSRGSDIPQATPFNDWPNDLRRNCTKANWFNGADIEGGLIFKIWHMNLKATVQYTYWMPDNTYEKFLEDNNLRYYLGLGFNW